MIVIDIMKNLIIYVACKIYRIMDGEEEYYLPFQPEEDFILSILLL